MVTILSQPRAHARWPIRIDTYRLIGGVIVSEGERPSRDDKHHAGKDRRKAFSWLRDYIHLNTWAVSFLVTLRLSDRRT